MPTPPMELLSVCLWRVKHAPVDTPMQRFDRAMRLLACLVRKFGVWLAPAPFLDALGLRLRRIGHRLARLAAQHAAGTLPPPATPRARQASHRPAAPRILPTRFGWLQQMIQVVVHPRSGVERLFDDAEFLAFLAAAPQAGRVLRPLCHMLGIPRPAILALPERPAPMADRQPSPPREAAPREAAPREAAPRAPSRPHPWKTNPHLQHLWGPLRHAEIA